MSRSSRMNRKELKKVSKDIGATLVATGLLVKGDLDKDLLAKLVLVEIYKQVPIEKINQKNIKKIIDKSVIEAKKLILCLIR